MKRILIFALILLPVGCRDREQHAEHATATAEQKAEDVYYCPMHPTVMSDKPGACPICAMTLVKKTAGPAATPGVALSPAERITANVKTVRVALDTHTGELVTTGRVTFDERRLAQVTA